MNMSEYMQFGAHFKCSFKQGFAATMHLAIVFVKYAKGWAMSDQNVGILGYHCPQFVSF